MTKSKSEGFLNGTNGNGEKINKENSTEITKLKNRNNQLESRIRTLTAGLKTVEEGDKEGLNKKIADLEAEMQLNQERIVEILDIKPDGQIIKLETGNEAEEAELALEEEPVTVEPEPTETEPVVIPPQATVKNPVIKDFDQLGTANGKITKMEDRSTKQKEGPSKGEQEKLIFDIFNDAAVAGRYSENNLGVRNYTVQPGDIFPELNCTIAELNNVKNHILGKGALDKRGEEILKAFQENYSKIKKDLTGERDVNKEKEVLNRIVANAKKEEEAAKEKKVAEKEAKKAKPTPEVIAIPKKPEIKTKTETAPIKKEASNTTKTDNSKPKEKGKLNKNSAKVLRKAEESIKEAEDRLKDPKLADYEKNTELNALATAYAEKIAIEYGFRPYEDGFDEEVSRLFQKLSTDFRSRGVEETLKEIYGDKKSEEKVETPTPLQQKTREIPLKETNPKNMPSPESAQVPPPLPAVENNPTIASTPVGAPKTERPAEPTPIHELPLSSFEEKTTASSLSGGSDSEKKGWFASKFETVKLKTVDRLSFIKDKLFAGRPLEKGERKLSRTDREIRNIQEQADKINSQKARDEQKFNESLNGVTDPELRKIIESTKQAKLGQYDAKRQGVDMKLEGKKSERSLQNLKVEEARSKVEAIEQKYNEKIDAKINKIKLDKDYDYEVKKSAEFGRIIDEKIAEHRDRDVLIAQIETRIPFIEEMGNKVAVKSLKDKVKILKAEQKLVQKEVDVAKKCKEKKDKIIAKIDHRTDKWNLFRRKVGLKKEEIPASSPIISPRPAPVIRPEGSRTPSQSEAEKEALERELKERENAQVMLDVKKQMLAMQVELNKNLKIGFAEAKKSLINLKAQIEKVTPLFGGKDNPELISIGKLFTEAEKTKDIDELTKKTSLITAEINKKITGSN